jgi:hypothetical protein
VTIVPPDTGFMHAKCYAAALGGCSTKISGEHPISHGALKLWANGPSIQIGGLTWLEEGEMRSIPTDALNAKILCESHNAALSPLDAVGLRFAEHLRATRQAMTTMRRRGPRTHLILNGLDIERWLLKTLCGLVASGSTDVKGIGDPREWRPSVEGLEILFGVRPMTNGCGLHFLGKPGERPDVVQEFGFASVSNANLGVYGLNAAFAEKRFTLAMIPGREGYLAGCAFRPAVIRSTNGLIEDLLMLWWSAPSDNTFIDIHTDNPRSVRGGLK